jgi:hypothetical protein
LRRPPGRLLQQTNVRGRFNQQLQDSLPGAGDSGLADTGDFDNAAFGEAAEHTLGRWLRQNCGEEELACLQQQPLFSNVELNITELMLSSQLCGVDCNLPCYWRFSWAFAQHN